MLSSSLGRFHSHDFHAAGGLQPLCRGVSSSPQLHMDCQASKQRCERTCSPKGERGRESLLVVSPLLGCTQMFWTFLGHLSPGNWHLPGQQALTDQKVVEGWSETAQV